MNLSTRLMAAMIALVVLTACTIGLLTGRSIEAITTPRLLAHIDARVRLLAAELEASVRGARADINADMRAAFSRVRAAAARTGDHIYVTNDQGYYLLHPDPARELGTGSGGRVNIQDEFPDLSKGLAPPRIVRDRAGHQFGAAATSVWLADGSSVSLIAMVPFSQIVVVGKAVRDATLSSGLIAVLLAIGLAFYLTHSFTRPIVQMTGAVEAFGRGAPMRMPIDAAGEIGVLAKAFQRMGTDVREKAAALARETEERRRLFDTSLDLILVTDPQGRFLQVSPSSIAILGYEPSEMIGRSIISFVHPDDLDACRQEVRLARRGREMRNFETRYLHKNGHAVTLVWSGVWSEPEQRHFFIGRDLTEQKMAMEMFRLAVEASPNGMVMSDAEGKILMINAETEKLFGYRRWELVGQRVDILLPQRLREKHAMQRDAFAVMPRQRMAAGRDVVGARKNGTEFPIEVTLNPIQRRGRLVVLAVVVDVTERTYNERIKSEFVATVSHELRTPLTSISGSLALLDAGTLGPIPEAAKRLLRVALDNSRRLVRLINDILDIEKLEAGKVSFDLKRTEVKALVMQAIEANAAFADTFNVKVRLDEHADEATVNADPDRLTQVVTNLLSNAVKFSPLGAEVSVSIRSGGGRVRIGVRDHGPGIPNEFRRRIFQKFAQADGTDARTRAGSGLGLSIVQQIVTRLGGTIGYEEAPGGGTIFTVDLPLWDVFAEPAGAGAEEPTPETASAPAARLPGAAA